MKIEHTDGGVGGPAGPSPDRAGEAGRTAAQGAGYKKTGEGEGAVSSWGDQVEVSSLGQRLMGLAVESLEGSERLEALSRQVETGRYEVEAEALSRHLIEEMELDGE